MALCWQARRASSGWASDRASGGQAFDRAPGGALGWLVTGGRAPGE
ncbi:hypothetical protein I547_7509 [Mycobacterium kansasii 824]|nr:hypothetical protein I547_7509 [Mycobacterium kansasii 824]